MPLRHSRVKVNDEDSVHLGAWLATQRREHLNGKMKPERLAMMQVLVDKGKLEWAPMNHSKQSEQTWPVMFDCLRLYCEERQAENPGTEVSSIPENRRWRHPDGHEVSRPLSLFPSPPFSPSISPSLSISCTVARRWAWAAGCTRKTSSTARASCALTAPQR